MQYYALCHGCRASEHTAAFSKIYETAFQIPTISSLGGKNMTVTSDIFSLDIMAVATLLVLHFDNIILLPVGFIKVVELYLKPIYKSNSCQETIEKVRATKPSRNSCK